MGMLVKGTDVVKEAMDRFGIKEREPGTPDRFYKTNGIVEVNSYFRKNTR